MAVKCKVCGKSMPTDTILKQHMIKRHSAAPQSTPEVKPEVQENVMVVETEGVPEGMVKIVSADDRVLECSINSDSWKGKQIVVPQGLEKEIRRILKECGFFLLN